MKWVKTKFLEFLDNHKILVGVAYTIFVAVITDFGGKAIQRSLNLPNIGLYLMALISLLCFIFTVGYLERFEKLVENPLMRIENLVGNSLTRIENLVKNRNYTRFITSKADRLTLMIECIKNAKHSIYILSDLADSIETQSKEHVNYLQALDQAIDRNQPIDRSQAVDSNKFKIKRIVGPAKKMKDRNWIYAVPSTIAPGYQEHFKHLQEYDKHSLSHATAPLNVSLILIDNKYLFWKPDVTYENELRRRLDGGLYLEDYTPEGIADFIIAFDGLFKETAWTDPEKAPWNEPAKIILAEPKPSNHIETK
jgi:hypothetical protein